MIGLRKAALSAAVVVSAVVSAGVAQAATFTTLYSFPNATAAANPAGGLYRSPQGVLYGTTMSGGNLGAPCPAAGCGVIFRLSPPTVSNPNWTRRILHNFTAAESSYVYSSLIADADGNLYGAGYSGGSNDGGAVFQLKKPAAGSNTWTFQVIYQMVAGRGIAPFGDLFFDSTGRIYLTTSSGGANDFGTVLRLTPPASGTGSWTPKVLHAFNETDGAYPSGGLVAGPDGSLYGTTFLGGQNGHGTIYQLTPPAAVNGAWTFRKLHDFAGGPAGRSPQGTLVLFNGFLYGTTTDGGLVGCDSGARCGTIFRFNLPSSPAGSIVLKVLYRMDPATDGAFPWTGLTLGPGNIFYGTNYLKGPGNQGTLFRLIPPGSGFGWRFEVLHSFTGSPDGDDSTATLLRGSDGKLYGATQYGGASDYGSIFSYEP